MVKRLLVYGFPFFLIALETIIRLALDVDSKIFIGPTLAGVGVGYLLPLTARKDRSVALSSSTLTELEEQGLSVTPKKEEILIDFVWLFIFALVVSWSFCVLVASDAPEHRFLGLSTPLGLGFSNYFVGVIASEIKEAV